MAEFTRQIADPTVFSSSPGSGGSSGRSSSSFEESIAGAFSGLASGLAEFSAMRTEKKNKEMEGAQFLSFYDAFTGNQGKDKVLASASRQAASIMNTAAQTGDYSAARTSALAEMRRWVAANPAYSREISGVFQLATGSTPGAMAADLMADQEKARNEQEEYLRNIPGDNPADEMSVRLERAATFSTDVERHKLALQKKLLLSNKKDAKQEDIDLATAEVLESAQSLGLRDIHQGLAEAMDGFDPNEDPEIRQDRLQRIVDVQAAAQLNVKKITEGSSKSEVQMQEVMAGVNMLINNSLEVVDGQKELSFFENWNKLTQTVAESKVRFDNKDLVRAMAIMSVMGGPQGISLFSLVDRNDLMAYVKRAMPTAKQVIGEPNKIPVIDPVTSSVVEHSGDRKKTHNEIKSLYKGLTPALSNPQNVSPEQWEDVTKILEATNDGLAQNYNLVANETKRATIDFYANPSFVAAPVDVSNSMGLISVLDKRVKELSKDLVARYKDISDLSFGLESQVEFKVNAAGTGIEAVHRGIKGKEHRLNQFKIKNIAQEINEVYMPEFNKAIRAYSHVYNKNTDYKVAAETLLATGGLSQQEAVVSGEFSSNEEKKQLKEMLMNDPKVQAAIADGSKTEADIDAAIEQRSSKK